MLEFYKDYIINSPKANFCVRWNNGCYSPFHRSVIWDYEAKSIIETTPKISQVSIFESRGVFAFSNDLYALANVDVPVKDAKKVILLLDYDDEDLLFNPCCRPLIDHYKKDYEICLRKANIVTIFYSGDEYKRAVESGKIEIIKAEYSQMKQRLFLSRNDIRFDLPTVGFSEGITNDQMASYLEKVQQLSSFYLRFHGFEHWRNVVSWANFLASYINGVDITVTTWFALFHDTQRKNEGRDVEHGARAQSYVYSFRETFLSPLSNNQMIKLGISCLIHTTAWKLDDATLQVCCDADRLDLYRCGIKPNPKYLFTDIAKKIAEVGKMTPTDCIKDRDFMKLLREITAE